VLLRRLCDQVLEFIFFWLLLSLCKVPGREEMCRCGERSERQSSRRQAGSTGFGSGEHGKGCNKQDSGISVLGSSEEEAWRGYFSRLAEWWHY
jgi:hypothetical protein